MKPAILDDKYCNFGVLLVLLIRKNSSSTCEKKCLLLIENSYFLLIVHLPPVAGKQLKPTIFLGLPALDSNAKFMI